MGGTAVLASLEQCRLIAALIRRLWPRGRTRHVRRGRRSLGNSAGRQRLHQARIVVRHPVYGGRHLVRFHQVVARREHVGRHQVGHDPSDLSPGRRRYVERVEQRLQLPDGKECPTQFSKLSGISPVSAQRSISARVSGTSSPRSAASKQARTCASISAGRSATTGFGAWVRERGATCEV